MNALGIALVWCGVQVSLLALAGTMIYLVLRRRGPAAGSQAALAFLVGVAGISALSLSPWPVWWRPSIAAASVTAGLNDVDRTSTVAAEPIAPNTVNRANAPSAEQRSTSPMKYDAATWSRDFAAAFWNGFNAPEATRPGARWRWPAVVALLLLIGAAVSLTRLAAGLFSVARYRRRTKPVCDAALFELLQQTCERLGCNRSIELRETSEIGSPATVGWRRPLILLPSDWPRWSDDELRGVLGHEVAHVLRGDFLASLAAQFAVALHFYNPLVHWLSARLRLEQELAADACGATAAGGNAHYLTTLASMALRQDNRTIHWAARPFLPARGTLLRRIEMLRDKTPLKPVVFSTSKQILVWSLLIGLGLFIVGLRGPAGSFDSLRPAKADPPNSAQSTTSTELSAETSSISAAKPIDLDYVPGEAGVVAAVRPGTFLGTDAGRLITATTEGGEIAKAEKRLGLPIAEIDHVTFVTNDFFADGPSLIIVRSIKPHDWTPFAKTIVHHPVVVESTLTELSHIKYFKAEGADIHAMCYMLPDDRTVIFAPMKELESVLIDMIKPEPKAEWSDLWNRGATGTAALLVDLRKLRKRIAPALDQDRAADAQAIVAMFGPVWRDSERLLVATDIKDQKLALLALLECTPESVPRAESTVQALLTLSQNELSALRQTEGHDQPEAVAVKKVLLIAAEDLVQKAHVSREGNLVVVKSEGNGATLIGAAGVALPAIAHARHAALRAQSMNNLKQLSLAMLNYESVNGHLPPAVVLGPDGKTPHSWRIEMLPYIEQTHLYQQYKMNEPWDSPVNKKIAETAVAVFHSPADSGAATNSSYFVLTGKGTMFSGREGMKVSDITGGTSNTIAIVEAKRDISWTKPEDIDYDSAKPLPKLGGFGEPGYVAAFADGSVRFFSDNVDPDLLRAFINPSADGKAILTPERR